MPLEEHIEFISNAIKGIADKMGMYLDCDWAFGLRNAWLAAGAGSELKNHPPLFEGNNICQKK